MRIQNAMQDGQNFLSKSAVRAAAQPQEETTRVERDKQERIAKKLELAGDGPAAVFIRSQQEEKDGKNLSPRQKEIGKLQERILKLQDKMTEIKNDDALTADEKKEKLKKLDEQLAPLQEQMQKLQEEELEKFKAQKEKAQEEKEKAAEKDGAEKAPPGETPAGQDASGEAPLDAGALAFAGASFDRAGDLLSLSKQLDYKATFWQHDLDDFIRHQTRPKDNPPPDPNIVAGRRDEIYAAKRAADRLEDASSDAVKDGGDALKKDKADGALPPQPNDPAEENEIRRGPYNAIGSAPAPQSAGGGDAQGA